MNILAIPDLIVPSLDAAALDAIGIVAGPGARITVATDPDQALRSAADTDVVFGLVEQSLVDRMPNLRWIQATSSGVDFMLFPALRDRDVIITCEKGMVGSHLADHAMALLLALTRQLAAAVRDGPLSWDRRFDYRHRAIELEGLMLGIVGFGGTGRALARRAAGFGMRIRAVDRYPMAGTTAVPEVEPLGNLDPMLAVSDVIALCVPLTQETVHLFNAERFACIKPGALLINVTRGELVAPDALVQALASGRLGGAGLDVLPREPLPADDALWGFVNVVMTPHTAGASQLRAGRNIERFIDNLTRYRNGEPLLGVVDKATGF